MMHTSSLAINTHSLLTVSLLSTMILFLIVSPVQSATFQLVDGTKLSGELKHYYAGLFEVAASEGTITIPKDTILSISFEVRAPKKEFSSPEETFKNWINAIKSNDTETMISCYGLLYQNVIVRQMKDLDEQERKDAFSDFLKNDLVVAGREEKDGSILLKLEYTENDKKEAMWLKFVNESGEWKIYP